MSQTLGVSLDYLADDALEDPPADLMSLREQQVWEVVQMIGADEAWRRLVGAPSGARAIVGHDEAGLVPERKKGVK